LAIGILSDWLAAYLARQGMAIAESVNPVETALLIQKVFCNIEAEKIE
jgi:hypothetical protein